uniref:Putative sulfotransferase n=1 Tax=Ixodes ricinus TaxID=34613 RepID=A0A0K8R7V1_IXORI
MAEPMYREVEGYYLHVTFSDECVRSALRYKPQPGELFIVSYPKCGTTWMQHIVYDILHGRSPPKDVLSFYREMPFLEFQGADSAGDMPRPGAIKTHMPFQLQPYSKDAKYIYITRNPYDCCVSFFYHTKAMPEYRFKDGTFDEFFEMFIEGTADFGDYFDHVLSWYEHRNDPNVLFVTYEDLKKDTAAWVLKIAYFIGEEYGRRLREDQRALDAILDKTSFRIMQQEGNCSFKQLYEDIKTIPEGERPEWFSFVKKAMGEDVLQNPMNGDFVRKGVVGDWRNHFSADQVKRLKERIELKTRGKNLMNLWKDADIP